MRFKGDWQPAQQGVMLYMPATRVSVEETQQSLSELIVADDTNSSVQTTLSRVSDTILPSGEIESEIQSKTECAEPHSLDSSKSDSIDTPGGSDGNEIFADAVFVEMPTPTASPNLMSQLVAAAQGQSHEDNTPNLVPPFVQATPTPIVDYIDVGDDSEKTDLEDTPSLSVRKTQRKSVSATEKTSRHFQRNSQLVTKKRLVRRLNFGAELKKHSAKATKKSASAQALEDLRNLERAPPHRWDEGERELLCIINRWYCGADRASELTVFSETFNSITGLNLRPHIIRNQYEGHLTLYGAEAYPVFGRVFDLPFDDPEGRYTEIRELIEKEAQALQLNLYRRRFDAKFPSGMAKHAKSRRTRNAYKSLVRRASREAKRQAGYLLETEHVSKVPGRIANMSMAVRTASEDDWELLSDIESSPQFVSNCPEGPKATSTRPHLTFRVCDSANRTKFIDGGFVAQTFVDWPRPFPMPIALNDSSNAGKILTVLHLSNYGDTPVFISTASSLLQALSYATKMQRPQFALVDLDAPSLREENKLHHAADVFTWLKTHGLARWARYKGNGEYFVFGEIPNGAVLHTLDLEQLIADLNNDKDCHQLLSFDAFEPGIKTSAIASKLREKNLVLNSMSARALGKTAKMFGMSQNNVTLLHIQDFVARVLDGWTIMKSDIVDTHTLSSLAAMFATTLGTHAGGYTIQDVMGAFIDGVDQGTRCIAHWSRSRSGSRRQRFREA